MSENDEEITITPKNDGLEKFYDAFGLRYEDVTIRAGSDMQRVVRIQQFAIEHIETLTLVVGELMEKVGDNFTIQAIASSGKIGLKLIALSADEPEENFKRLSISDSINLVAALIKVNESFFEEIPRLSELGVILMGAIGRA